MTGHSRTTISRRDAVRLFAASALAGGAATAASGVAARETCGPDSASAHFEKGFADMTPDLADLAPEHFEPLIGHTFSVGPHQVTLRDVRRRGRPTPRFREQFALVFALPDEVPIGSELLPVAHPAIGRHDLLVTQILDGTDGTALEICFS